MTNIEYWKTYVNPMEIIELFIDRRYATGYCNGCPAIGNCDQWYTVWNENICIKIFDEWANAERIEY